MNDVVKVAVYGAGDEAWCLLKTCISRSFGIWKGRVVGYCSVDAAPWSVQNHSSFANGTSSP